MTLLHAENVGVFATFLSSLSYDLDAEGQYVGVILYFCYILYVNTTLTSHTEYSPESIIQYLLIL